MDISCSTNTFNKFNETFDKQGELKQNLSRPTFKHEEVENLSNFESEFYNPPIDNTYQKSLTLDNSLESYNLYSNSSNIYTDAFLKGYKRGIEVRNMSKMINKMLDNSDVDGILSDFDRHKHIYTDVMLDYLCDMVYFQRISDLSEEEIVSTISKFSKIYNNVKDRLKIYTKIDQLNTHRMINIVDSLNIMDDLNIPRYDSIIQNNSILLKLIEYKLLDLSLTEYERIYDDYNTTVNKDRTYDINRSSEQKHMDDDYSVKIMSILKITTHDEFDIYFRFKNHNSKIIDDLYTDDSKKVTLFVIPNTIPELYGLLSTEYDDGCLNILSYNNSTLIKIIDKFQLKRYDYDGRYDMLTEIMMFMRFYKSIYKDYIFKYVNMSVFTYSEGMDKNFKRIWKGVNPNDMYKNVERIWNNVKISGIVENLKIDTSGKNNDQIRDLINMKVSEITIKNYNKSISRKPIIESNNINSYLKRNIRLLINDFYEVYREKNLDDMIDILEKIKISKCIFVRNADFDDKLEQEMTDIHGEKEIQKIREIVKLLSEIPSVSSKL